MKRITHLLLALFLFIPYLGKAQEEVGNPTEIWTDPAVYNLNQEITWYFNLEGTGFDEGQEIYLWAWSPSEPDAGNWGNSSDFAKLTYIANMVWKLDLTPTEYFNKTLVELENFTDFWMLLKDKTGTKKSGTISIPVPQNTLPLKFVNFNVYKENHAINLQWKTMNEIKNSHFNILYSTDGIVWTTIGKVEAKGQANNIYKHQHFYPKKANNYYKLQQIDIDGTFTNSEIKIIDFSLLPTTIKVYPNPVTETLKVQLPNQLIGRSYMIYDITGTKVKQIKIENVNQAIDVGSLTIGTYFLKIENEPLFKIIKQ